MVGLALILVPAAFLGYGYWQQTQLTRQWQQVVAGLPPLQPIPVEAGTPTPGPAPRSPAPAGAGPAQRSPELLFAIRVPKIGYYAPVRQGVSLDVLYFGPGHYPTTPMPGQAGNVGVAAHNVYWIAFGRLVPGDTVILEARYGTYYYRITGSEIVQPDNTAVLAPSSDYRLTLTTCWPLWAGAFATQRLVFFAVQYQAVPR